MQPGLIAATLLLVLAPVSLGAVAGDESLVINAQPGEEIIVRVITERHPGVRLSMNARARGTDQTIRLGISAPGLAAGPVTLAGSYADLANPMTGTSAGDRWYVPGRITVDTTLVPASRIGVFVTPVPRAAAFAWYVLDTLTVGATLNALVDRERFRLHGEITTAYSHPVAEPGEDDPRDGPWFGMRPAEPVVHALVSTVGSVGPVRVGLGATGSVPRTTMPGLLVRAAADVRPRRWRFAGAGAMTTPEFQDVRNRRPGDHARWSVSARYAAPRLSAAVEHERTYRGPNDAYAGVGFVPEAWSPRPARSNARIAVRPWVSGPGVRTIGVDGRLDWDLSAWRARVHARVVLPGARVEMTPSVTMRPGGLVDYRVRTASVVAGPVMDRLVPGSSLHATLVLEYTGGLEEDRGVASTLELIFRARQSGVSRGDAAGPAALPAGIVLEPIPHVDDFAFELEAQAELDFASDVLDDGADVGGGR